MLIPSYRYCLIYLNLFLHVLSAHTEGGTKAIRKSWADSLIGTGLFIRVWARWRKSGGGRQRNESMAKLNL